MKKKEDEVPIHEKVIESIICFVNVLISFHVQVQEWKERKVEFDAILKELLNKGLEEREKIEKCALNDI